MKERQKMKKVFITLVILSVCQITRAVDVNILDPNLYLQKIRELEQTAKAQQQKIDQLTAALEDAKKENEQLRELCKKAGVKIPTLALEETNFNSGEIVYRGKQRTPKWFDRMYERFHDKIAYADGRYYDIQEGGLNQKMINEEPFPIGTFAKTPEDCKVHRTLTNREAVIIRPASENSTTVYRPASRYGQWPASAKTYVNTTPELLFHVKGIADNLVDGEPFSTNKLIYIGSYTYEDREIQSFIVCEPLTKEQFAEAIKSGFVLINYTKIDKKNINKYPVP
jgi:hypothetical protein